MSAHEALVALVGAGIGLIVGGGVVFFIVTDWAIEQRAAALDRLETVKTKLTAWSMSASRFGNAALGAAFAEQAEQVQNEIERMQKAK